MSKLSKKLIIYAENSEISVFDILLDHGFSISRVRVLIKAEIVHRNLKPSSKNIIF